MDKLTRFAIKHARFTWLLIIVTVIGGIMVYINQPRQEDPEIAIRSAQVITSFPGMSPARIEKLITRPVEEQIKTISEVKDIESVSMTGISIVSPVVDDRYTDMSPIWNKLRNKMDDLAPQLPGGTDGPYVNDDYGRVTVVTLALTGRDFSMAELYEAAKEIRDDINTLPLVARVDMYGVQNERVWIKFNTSFMAQFGITPAQIISTINNQNIVLPGGTVEAGPQNIVIEPSGDFQSVDEIRNVVIETSDGQLVYLDDLARIQRGYVTPPESPVYYNGKQAIVLGISMVSKSNVVELGNQVNNKLKTVKKKLPLGMDLDTVIFQPDLVQASVNNASVNLMQTVIVVLAVVMIFLGLRTGLIVGVMVPLTMMVTLIGMSVFGIELHRVSIAAIIVALGLLVDNGVVVAEDIKKRIDSGTERFKATLETPKSLAVPLLTSSFTTIAAFLPLILISGGVGEFLRSLGQVLAMALLTSWLIAITVIPAFCYWFFPEGKNDRTSEENNENSEIDFNTPAYRFYNRFLNKVLRLRLAFIFIMIVILLSSFFIFSFVKERSLGPSERNQFTAYIDLPSEARVAETVATTLRVSEFLCDRNKNPEVTDVLSYIGSGGPRFFLTLSPNDPQPNKAFMVVNTAKADQIYTVMSRLNRFFIEELPEANGRTDILFLGESPLSTVEIKVTGPDIITLKKLGSDIEDAFHSVPGARSIRNDWENSVIKVMVNVDQERARQAGVTSKEIARTLSTYFDGTNITGYREGDKVIPVAIRARSADRATLDQVRAVEIFSSSRGIYVPLIQVADFSAEIETSRIKRFNQDRALTVAGIHPDMTAIEYYEAMKDKLDEIDLPPNYKMEVEGEIKESRENNEELLDYAPHALLIILVLLILQFNSFRRVAIIFLTIPLILIGANYGLFVFRAYFDFTAMLGLFSLAGIIVNNGIVMIDRIEEQRSKGLDVNSAVIDAAMARARPIIMTTITTVVGLIPLALFGGEFWYGMAIVIMCGLGVGTILTLGFVPVLYSLFFAGFNRKV